MQLSNFDFDLPRELISQLPPNERDHSNLLVVEPSGKLIKTRFYNIIDYLSLNDLIIFNNSKVIKAKLILDREGKKIDFYLHKKVDENHWSGFAKPAKKLKERDKFKFGKHEIIVSKRLPMGETELEFELHEAGIFEFLEQYGQMPLPPYIKRPVPEKVDEERYQTIYNKVPGSIAAPTAGLHFTSELLQKIKEKNVQTTFITLHVGGGTLLPIKAENINEHAMHEEYYSISEKTAEIINNAKKEGRRIIAVGTTVMRALESAATTGIVQAGEFATRIFIRPGFKFQLTDVLITNFHVPKSTLFILVCAFAGYQKMFKAYEYAIGEKMRFFSYGDVTLLYNKENMRTIS